MPATSRRQQILDRLDTDGYVEAKALSDDLGVDPSTIRRDLDALTRAGRVHRTHGGARRVAANPGDIPYAVKLGEQRAEKTAIATAAAAMIQDGDTVILDSGSTTYEIATALHRKRHLTIITNDLRIARFVATLPDTRLLVTGGEVLGSVFTLVGDRAVEFLGDYTADRTFLGADAVDPAAGITNTNTLEIPLKRAMITAAESTVVVCDSSKFGKRALARVAGLHEVSLIITDEGLPEHDGDEYGQHLTRVPLPAPQRLAASLQQAGVASTG